ncbi:hypothetical protein [Rhizobium sp. MHM7A]|uniref:hypothetical protein n=1 Tax=Rhizobium sp. MHM7A TaxID=2583233 RepID=UPI001105C67C|nr:hypothetical protein [Rhizobium sp. MHM7A]TLX16133.1 hypothetical protein FFR93_02070 [Rhizobium sp. MHM7A]
MNRNLPGDMTEADWTSWNALIAKIEELIGQESLWHTIVFHGTTDHFISDIIQKGLRPTIVSHARFKDESLIEDQKTFRHYGSFWATAKTAAWYAHSGVTERFGYGKPVLVAALTSEFGNDFPLMPDKSSAESPVDPSARINHRNIAERWFMDGHQRDWREAIDDIGAVYAIHHERLPTNMLRVISSMDDLISILKEKLALEIGSSPTR